MSQEWKQEANFLPLFLFSPCYAFCFPSFPFSDHPLPLLHEISRIPKQNYFLFPELPFKPLPPNPKMSECFCGHLVSVWHRIKFVAVLKSPTLLSGPSRSVSTPWFGQATLDSGDEWDHKKKWNLSSQTDRNQTEWQVGSPRSVAEMGQLWIKNAYYCVFCWVQRASDLLPRRYSGVHTRLRLLPLVSRWLGPCAKR